MQLLAKMNAKLDIGWKLTNISCPVCNGTTLAEPGEGVREIYCPKCDKLIPFEELQPESDQEQLQKTVEPSGNEDDYYEEVFRSYKPPSGTLNSTLPNNINHQQQYNVEPINSQDVAQAMQKSSQVSKKIGEKLLQGWTMLNETCMDCLAPLMKSKKGEKICFGCNKDYAKVELKQAEKKAETVAVVVRNEDKASLPKAIPLQADKPMRKQQERESLDFLTRMQQKSLTFLQRRLDTAIEDNDLSRVEKILELAFKIKHQFK